MEVITATPKWRDLAPMTPRQRLVVEGTCREPITDERITATHLSDTHGWAGWIHWENSGAHFYAWEEPMLFFSVDIYTCKRFDAAAVTEFTRDYLDAVEVVAKEF